MQCTFLCLLSKFLLKIRLASYIASLHMHRIKATMSQGTIFLSPEKKNEDAFKGTL